MGGADPENVTERVVRELIGNVPEEIQVKVVIGGNNPHGSAIRAATAPAAAQFECLDHVTEMPELLGKCDLAICAVGATCWEMAFMGVPALAIILAENQAPLAAALDHLGCGISLGWHHQLVGADLVQMIKNLIGESDRTALMARRGQALVDGLGATRVVDCLGIVKIQPQLF
jgi:spore coat polysaccharide biosynthesis predicted glycosyltransferase SpsG